MAEFLICLTCFATGVVVYIGCMELIIRLGGRP